MKKGRVKSILSFEADNSLKRRITVAVLKPIPVKPAQKLAVRRPEKLLLAWTLGNIFWVGCNSSADLFSAFCGHPMY